MGKYINPLWAEEGMDIWLPWNKETNKPDWNNPTGTALKCKVVCAAGKHVKISNEKYGVDKWYHLDYLLVPPNDCHIGS